MKHNCTLLLLMTALPLALSPSAMGQDFPAPKPAEAHKILAKEVGTWDASIKMFFGGPDAPPTVYKGVETVEKLSGGLHVRSTFKGKFGDRDFEGHGLMGYDSSSKKYLSSWVDNFTEAPLIVRGGYNADKKKLTLRGTVVGPEGNEMKIRQELTWLDEKTKKFEQYLLIAEGQEFKLMEMVLKKRD